MSKKVNKKSKNKALLAFLGQFTMLSVVLFLTGFFFFKSYDLQSKIIQQDVIAYKEILNKQQMLKVKFDTIFYQMSLLNSGRVKNDVFLGNYISQNISTTRNFIGNDSTNDFKYYALLLNRLDSIMILKNELVVISDKERLALNDLNECIGKITKVKSELSKDPTRNFNVK